jgi:hypothetical protein
MIGNFADMAKADFRRVIDDTGVEILFRNYTVSGKDNYGQLIYTATEYSLKAITESMKLSDVRFVEAGYLPDHYLYFNIHADDVTFTFNLAKDEVEYQGTTYILRNVFPYKVGDTVVYWKVLTRRKVVT